MRGRPLLSWRPSHGALAAWLCGMMACQLSTAQPRVPPGMAQAPSAAAVASAPPPMAQPGPSIAEIALSGVWAWEYVGAGGEMSRFLMQRRPDGTFTLLSRTYQNGRAVTELVNAGLWGVSNGLYFTVTTEVNGQRVGTRDSSLYNPYVILALEGDELRYLHLPSGLEFRTRKMPIGTRLPE